MSALPRNFRDQWPHGHTFSLVWPWTNSTSKRLNRFLNIIYLVQLTMSSAYCCSMFNFLIIFVLTNPALLLSYGYGQVSRSLSVLLFRTDSYQGTTDLSLSEEFYSDVHINHTKMRYQ